MLWQLPNKSTCDECWAERGPLCLLKSAGSDQRLLSASAFEVGPASPALRPARQFMTRSCQSARGFARCSFLLGVAQE